jgi:hypothetical protein
MSIQKRTPAGKPETQRSPIKWPSVWGAPRLLTRDQVRSYLQIEDAELTQRMARGSLFKFFSVAMSPEPAPVCGRDALSARRPKGAVGRLAERDEFWSALNYR